MIKVFTYAVMLNLALNTFAQQKKVLFSDAVSQHLHFYNQICQEATFFEDFERVNRLFDSLVSNHLKGTYFEDLKIKQFSGGYFNSEKLDKPILLNTTSSWFVKTDEEIEAINNLAHEFDGKVSIVMLFWDTRKDLKEIAKKYHQSVIIAYVDETLNLENSIINTYKHSFGLPTSFYITSEKEIINIDRGIPSKLSLEPDPELYALNYGIFSQKLVQLLLKDNLSKSVLTDTD